LREPVNILGRQQLRVLDTLAKAERLPVAASFLEGVEGVAIRPIADCVHSDREARP
jgi:hypothetical protein